MSIRLASRRSAVVGLAFTTVIAGGIAAYAYPSDTPLNVVASSDKAGKVTITVNNINPQCDARVRVDGATPAEYTFLRNGTTTFTNNTIFTASGGRDHDVRVRAVNCTKGEDKEHAKTQIVIPDGQATPRDAAEYKKNYRIDVTGVAEDQDIDLVVTPPNGNPTLADHDTANARGEGNVKVKLDQHGTWSIVVNAGGVQIGVFSVTV